MTRPFARAALVAAVVATLSMLSGCAATVALQPAAHATDARCAKLVALLPPTVATLSSRETNAQGTGAWGTPAGVVLQCGVAVPGPTAALRCNTIEGVDWLTDPSGDPSFVFTTYGRNPAVSVTVNNTRADGSGALTDLAPSVKSIPATRHCIAEPGPGATTTPTPAP